MSKDLTVIITTFKSDLKIENCLNSINSQIKVIIIENSQSESFRVNIEKKYKNVECILPEENLGYSKANNLGLSKVKTKYALILNPDTVLDPQAINNFLEFTKNYKDFAIVGPNQNEQIKNNFKATPFEVKKIKGYAMFLNLSKFSNIGYFDENFFLYLEEIDLCKRVKQINEKIYVDPNIQVLHLGGASVDPEFSEEVELNRNWHWMWSRFYFNKKHSNYFFALISVIPKLFSSILKIIIYSVTFKTLKRKIYLMRLSGLINSIIGKSSWHRITLS
jgi:N-acetylglucosaminyl-diphospho-decaprenol L-rhamnosyltransferase